MKLFSEDTQNSKNKMGLDELSNSADAPFCLSKPTPEDFKAPWAPIEFRCDGICSLVALWIFEKICCSIY